MYQTTIGLIAATFGVALLHAVMPNHWMPFVLVSKAQGWSITRMLTITGIASLGHSIITCVIGFVVAVMGYQVTRYVESRIVYLTGIILIILGIAYVVLSRWRRVRLQTHAVHSMPKIASTRFEGTSDSAHYLSDKVATTSLFTMLCFSPCEAALPIFLAASAMSWGILLTMAIILTTSTLLGMLALTTFAYRGVQRLKFERLERYERELVGAILIFIGIMVIILH
ncbi:MAG TPA: hypothetical protein ACFYD6_03780 [Candidatus Brocadiia bacterium]|nr:hypothetical protein [Candidatus Brocadiales bacterium]